MLLSLQRRLRKHQQRPKSNTILLGESRERDGKELSKSHKREKIKKSAFC